MQLALPEEKVTISFPNLFRNLPVVTHTKKGLNPEKYYDYKTFQEIILILKKYGSNGRKNLGKHSEGQDPVSAGA
jgi:hypothetical protein